MTHDYYFIGILKHFHRHEEDIEQIQRFARDLFSLLKILAGCADRTYERREFAYILGEQNIIVMFRVPYYFSAALNGLYELFLDEDLFNIIGFETDNRYMRNIFKEYFVLRLSEIFKELNPEDIRTCDI